MSSLLLKAVPRHLEALRNLCGFFGNGDVKEAIKKSLAMLEGKAKISNLEPLSAPFFIACKSDHAKFRTITLDFLTDLFELSTYAVFPSFKFTVKCMDLILKILEPTTIEERMKTCKAISAMIRSPSATFFIHGQRLSTLFGYLLELHHRSQETPAAEVVEMTIHESLRQVIGYYGKHSIVPEFSTVQATAAFMTHYAIMNAITISEVLPGVAGAQISDADMASLIRAFTQCLEKRELGIATLKLACTGLAGILQTPCAFFKHEAFDIVLHRDIHITLLSLALDSKSQLAGRFAQLLVTVWKKFAHVYVHGLYEVLDKGLLLSLSSPNTDQIAKTYHVYRTIAREAPQLFVDMLVNYDWDSSGNFRSLFELTIEAIVKHAYPKDPNHGSALATVKSIVQGLSEYLNKDFGDKDKGATDVLIENKKLKDVFLAGVNMFNDKPSAGIKYFIENKFIEDESQIPMFLFKTPQLDQVAVGNYIGHEKSVEILKNYVALFDFRNRGFEDCFREFLTKFRIPGEAQMIDRIMEQFGAKYDADNPGVFKTADTVYVLAFSALLLHTDAHHPQLKSRMTLDEFLKNNQGIDGGKDLPRQMLVDLYNGITSKRIYVTTAQSAQDALLTREQKAELYAQKCSQILQDARQMSLNSNCVFNRIESADIIGPLFKVIWGGVLAVFTISFDASDEPVIIKICLDGLRYCLHIASRCYIEEALTTLVNSFSRFTRLRTYVDEEIKPKNIECTRALLKVAVDDRNFLRGVWSIVADEVSAVDKSKLFTVPDILFTGSHTLDRESIKDFVRAMCETSAGELHEDPPRTYMLLKLSDVAHFNMDRPKFIWKEIWEIMSEHIIEVGSTESGNENVLSGTVNVLWQITSKFIAKPETNAFHFQEHFMRPFFEIFIAQPSLGIKRFIIECCTGLVDGFSGSLHSGWNVVFQILTQASNEFREAGYKLLVNIIMNHIKTLNRHQIIHLISVVLAFITKGAKDDKISCSACNSLLEICKQLKSDEDSLELWQCVYDSLVKSMVCPGLELRKCVLTTAVSILSECSLDGLVREKVSGEFIPAVFEACVDIEQLDALLQEMKQKHKDLSK